MLYTKYYILYTIYLLYIIYYILYNILSIYDTLYTIYYILYTIHYILIIYYILHTIYYILYTIYLLYTIYTIHYILYTIHYILYTIYNIYYLLSTIYYLLYTVEREGYHVPTADLQLCHDFRKYRTMDVFTYADVGESFETKRKIAFRRDKDMAKDEWWYAQTHLKDSALIAWPLRRQTFQAGGKTITYFEPDTDHREIKLISIWDVKDITACEVAFKSFAWQRFSYPVQTRTWTPAIRLFLHSAPEPYFCLCCRKAFWGMSRTLSERLVASDGIRLGKGLSYARTQIKGK